MTAPRRIQLRRTKGWRKPDDAIVVARPSRWGNPWRVDRAGDGWQLTCPIANGMRYALSRTWSLDKAAVIAEAVNMYRLQLERWFEDEYDGDAAVALAELRGHNLCCWCPLDSPCHADVLLELANR